MCNRKTIIAAEGIGLGSGRTKGENGNYGMKKIKSSIPKMLHADGIAITMLAEFFPTEQG
jgi:hypothetical protein